YLRTYAHEPREAVTMFPSHEAEPLFWSGIFTDKDKYLYQWYDDFTRSDLFIHGIASLELRHRTSPDDASVLLGNIGGRFSERLVGALAILCRRRTVRNSGIPSLLSKILPWQRTTISPIFHSSFSILPRTS